MLKKYEQQTETDEEITARLLSNPVMTEILLEGLKTPLKKGSLKFI